MSHSENKEWFFLSISMFYIDYSKLNTFCTQESIWIQHMQTDTAHNKLGRAKEGINVVKVKGLYMRTFKAW